MARWQPAFREIATDEVFRTRTYAPGEDFSDQERLFFLDVDSGEIELWALPGVTEGEEAASGWRKRDSGDAARVTGSTVPATSSPGRRAKSSACVWLRLGLCADGWVQVDYLRWVLREGSG